MKAPSEDIKDFLVANAGKTFGQDRFISVEPDTAPTDNIVTLYDYSGTDSDPKFNIEVVNIQFRSRSDSYNGAYETLSDLKVLLEGKREDVTINGTRYFGFYVTSQPTFILRDKSERYIFTMNMHIQRNPEEAGNRV